MPEMEKVENEDCPHSRTVNGTEEDKQEACYERARVECFVEHGSKDMCETNLQKNVEDIYAIISKDPFRISETEEVLTSDLLETSENNKKSDDVKSPIVSFEGNTYDKGVDANRGIATEYQTMVACDSSHTFYQENSLTFSPFNFKEDAINTNTSDLLQNTQDISQNVVYHKHKIHGLPILELMKRLSSCPVCEKGFAGHKPAGGCLTRHGKRQCWLCLDVVPPDKTEFLKHCMKFHHVVSTSDSFRCPCPYCGKFFDFSHGINQHIVKTHFYRAITESGMNPTAPISGERITQRRTSAQQTQFHRSPNKDRKNQQLIRLVSTTEMNPNVVGGYNIQAFRGQQRHPYSSPQIHTARSPVIFQENEKHCVRIRRTFVPVEQAFSSMIPIKGESTKLNVVEQGKRFMNSYMYTYSQERRIELMENPSSHFQEQYYGLEHENQPTYPQNTEGGKATGDPKFPNENFSPQDISQTLSSVDSNDSSHSPRNQQQINIELSDSSFLAVKADSAKNSPFPLDDHASTKKHGVVQAYNSPSASATTNDSLGALFTKENQQSGSQVADTSVTSTTAKQERIINENGNQKVETGKKPEVSKNYTGSKPSYYLGPKKSIFHRARKDEFNANKALQSTVPQSHALVHDLHAATAEISTPNIRRASQLEKIIRPSGQSNLDSVSPRTHLKNQTKKQENYPVRSPEGIVPGLNAGNSFLEPVELIPQSTCAYNIFSQNSTQESHHWNVEPVEPSPNSPIPTANSQNIQQAPDCSIGLYYTNSPSRPPYSSELQATSPQFYSGFVGHSTQPTRFIPETVHLRNPFDDERSQKFEERRASSSSLHHYSPSFRDAVYPEIFRTSQIATFQQSPPFANRQYVYRFPGRAVTSIENRAPAYFYNLP